MDIEDVSKNREEAEFSSYEMYPDLIDAFVRENSHLKTWKTLHRNILEFKRENKIELRKIDLIKSYRALEMKNDDFYNILVKKSMRSESGVLVVTVFTSAFPEYTDAVTGKKKVQKFSCRHNCYYCPSEPAREENNWVAQPRSYLYKEPGVLRANKANYDCVAQMYMRIEQYISMGHPIDKLEVLVLGGTFSEYPEEYREEFCRDIYYAANVVLMHPRRQERRSLREEIQENETAQVRVIGLTLETRPDCITLDEIKRLRSFGCTRLQMGIQHTDDEILKLANRGHTIETSKKALKMLKNACFKVDGHFMPNLLGATPEKDTEMLNTILDDPDLQFDQLKIYPLQIVDFSVFKKMYDEGKFKTYPDEVLKRVLINFKNKVHPWIRLNRVIRDINLYDVIDGCKVPNMRQLILQEAKCRCIRCREVKGKSIGTMFLKTRKYEASDGIEYFLSYESKDESVLYGFLRLRIEKQKPNDVQLKELKGCAFVRELHVYGKLSVVGSQTGKQHRGIGSYLLREAKRISVTHGYTQMVVISGVGTREYYKKRGFRELTENGYLKKYVTSFEILWMWVLSCVFWILCVCRREHWLYTI